MLTNATSNTYTKKKALRDQLSTNINKSKTLYKITKTLTTDIKGNILPPSSSNKELADSSTNFFVEKVNKIRSEFQHDETYNMPTRNCNTLSNFQTITEEELINTIKTMNSTTCSNDPCNTKFLLSFSQILVPVWTKMTNNQFCKELYYKT